MIVSTRHIKTILIMATLCLASTGCNYKNHKAFNAAKDEKESIKTVWTYQSAIGQITTKVFENDGLIYAGSESGEMYCISKETKELVWKKEKYPDFTWLDFHQGKIFFGSSDFKFYCLDQKTGNIVWLHSLDEGLFSKVSFMADFIYFGTSGNNLYCLDILTGRLVWKFSVNAQIMARPVISQGYVVCGTLDGSVYCCNGISGKLKWSAKLDEPIRNNPATIGKNIFIAAGKKLHCLENQQGITIWTKTNDSVLINSIEVFDSRVFYQTYKNLVCMTSKGVPVWISEPAKDDLYHGNFDCEQLIVDENGAIVVDTSKIRSFDIQKGFLQWECDYSNYKSSYPVNSNNELYFLTSDSVIKCLSTLTGETLWNFIIPVGYKNVWSLGKDRVIANSLTTVYPPKYSESEESYTDNTLYCLDASNGNRLWTTGGFRDVTVIDGNIFALKSDNSILRINPDTGIQKWEFEAVDQIDWDLKIDGNLLYLVTKDIKTENYEKKTTKTVLHCIVIDTGKQVWERETAEPIDGGWYLSNGKIFFTYSNGIVCVDAKTNKTLWMYEISVKTYKYFSSIGGKLFVGFPKTTDYETWVEYGGSFLCIDTTSGKLSWKLECSCDSEILAGTSRVSFACDKSYVCYDADKGMLLWQKTLDTKEYGDVDSSNIVDKNIIIVNNGNIESIDYAKGELNWSCKDFENSYINVYYTSNWAIVAGHSGKIGFLNLDTGIVEVVKDINLDNFSSVLAQDGFLYVPDEKGLVCLSVDYRKIKRNLPTVSIQADNPIMTINSVGIQMDSMPLTFSQTMYVEPEYFETAFKFSVKQDDKLRTVVVSYGSKKVVFTRGLSKAIVDGEEVSIEKGLLLANGKVLLPVTTICSLFGGEVSYDEKTKVSLIEWEQSY